ncbi:MAG: cyclopropane-fatty-acyl-phospholipid synthase family protein [Erythrobacter sp.]|uniref:SAM-dependent methyltransferase n=1 Tax=Erythrobacter sp. TaxID=1042 RepID=UPI0026065276|nr:cyclopropane-fatty-acyl-phospholipid synthase family protein [Erythrobacter sp.]MDJ0977887.1 cyclopropane-fatty-acyl-phospholipid synthase family protein [Erythrobacter sp.]
MNAGGVGTGSRGEPLLSGGARFASAPGLLSRLIAPGFRAIINAIDRGLERGSLLAHLPDGSSELLGGRRPGFDAQIHVRDWRALLRLATSGSIGWYQAYEAGEWECDDLVALYAIMGDNALTLGNAARASGPFRWAANLAHRYNRNNRAGAQRNVAAHYDLGNDFYRAWLDPSMSYSSALGLDPMAGEDGLEAAQRAKIEAIVKRLGRPSDALEIGCGWGTLSERLADRGANVTAISLSDEQLAYARSRCSPFIRFEKRDYRDVEGQYDAIACVEMVEALGREYWGDFMDVIARSLRPGGRAAIQYISMAEELFESYAGSAEFIQAYIFPGGLLIKTSEFRALAQARGLGWHDQCDFGLDYAETLKRWRTRFESAVEKDRLPDGFDARFVRLWRTYLAYCEAGFRCRNVNAHQVTLTKS